MNYNKKILGSDVEKNFPHGFLVFNARTGETYGRFFNWREAFYAMMNKYNELLPLEDQKQPWEMTNGRKEFYTECLYYDSDYQTFSFENETNGVCVGILILDRI